jgi:cytochrome c553
MRSLATVSVLASIYVMGCSAGDRYSGLPSTTGAFESPPLAADLRPVTTAPTPPPPISGGTLLVTRDGKLAVAADPDRDRVSIVSLLSRAVVHTVQLQPRDEPGRVVEDDKGRVHVLLRKGGGVVAIDLGTGEILSRREVCGGPRGIAYEASTDYLHVACANGQLVTFAASGGDAVRRVTLDVDLRDVIVTPKGLLVSRFKSAELLRIDSEGALVERIGARGISRLTDKAVFDGDPQVGGFQMTQVVEPIEPSVAWRTVASPDGTISMLHQYALAAPIVLDDPGARASAPTPVQQPYGAPVGGCGGLVQPGVTSVGVDGSVHPGAPIPGSILAVDTAVSPDSQWIAVANAGTRDPNAPSTGLSPSIGTSGGTVSIFAASNLAVIGDGPAPCAQPISVFDIVGQTTAVAFNSRLDDAAKATNTWVVAQTREPASLVFLRDPTGGERATVDLGGASVEDTGHAIFHRDSGGGIACASCHAEGGEDGRVWKFQPLGDRRTQAIDVGLEGTAPFHWDGDMATFDTLVKEVFVHRMGGPEESPERTDALSRWVFSLTPPSPIVDARDESAARGRALFESAAVGCATCHAGEKLTSNVNAEVGTTERGHSLQVPSLRGVGYRAPFLHDGRAATLLERFDPAKGGGDAHGHTSDLSGVQIGDLVSYLDSL